jgi:hypothetical protein
MGRPSTRLWAGIARASPNEGRTTPGKEAEMTRRKGTRMPDVGASVKRLQAEGKKLVRGIRRDALALRKEIVKDVGMLRKDVGDRAGHAIRALERRLMKELHAATVERVAALERRVARLEKALVPEERAA